MFTIDPKPGASLRVNMSVLALIGTSGHLDKSFSISSEVALARESAKTSAKPSNIFECRSKRDLRMVTKLVKENQAHSY